MFVPFPSLRVTAHGDLRMHTRWGAGRMAVRKHGLFLFRANSRALRTMAEAVNCWPVNAEAQVRSQATVCVCVCVRARRVCSLQSGTVTGSSGGSSALPSQQHSINASNALKHRRRYAVSAANSTSVGTD